jgi:hypothetical protein
MLSRPKKAQVEGFWKELVFRIRARIVPSGLEMCFAKYRQFL